MIALDTITHLLLQYRYAILFPIAVFEGPIITVIGAFLAAQGILNVYLVFLLVVAGDIVGDSLYYAIGRYGGRAFISRWGKLFGIKAERLYNNEQHFEKHAGKTLFFGKSQPYGSIILTAAGMAKMPYLKFIWLNLIATMIKSVILVAVGYFFGQAYEKIDQYLNYFGIIATIIVAIIVVLYYIKKRYAKNSDNN